MNHKKIRVWDLPIRIFHWTLLLSVTSAFLSIKYFDNIEIHFLSGLLTLSLLIFRIFWGFSGTKTAQFKSFKPSLRETHRYLKSGKNKNYIGHSPLAAFAVFLLLTSLLTQALSGLFMGDEIYFTAPLNSLINAEQLAIIATIHHYNSKLLLFLIGMHIVAICIYLYKKHNLITPMITGKKWVDASTDDDLEIGRPSKTLLLLSVVIAFCTSLYLYVINTY